MLLKMKKINEGRKKVIVDYLSTLRPAPKQFVLEVLKIPNFLVFCSAVVTGSIKAPIFIVFFAAKVFWGVVDTK